MNFFLNHALICLNTAQMPKNIFLMIIEKHILIIQNMLYKSSSNSHSVQVSHQQIRGGKIIPLTKPNNINSKHFRTPTLFGSIIFRTNLFGYDIKIFDINFHSNFFLCNTTQYEIQNGVSLWCWHNLILIKVLYFYALFYFILFILNFLQVLSSQVVLTSEWVRTFLGMLLMCSQ